MTANFRKRPSSNYPQSRECWSGYWGALDVSAAGWAQREAFAVNEERQHNEEHGIVPDSELRVREIEQRIIRRTLGPKALN